MGSALAAEFSVPDFSWGGAPLFNRSIPLLWDFDGDGYPDLRLARASGTYSTLTGVEAGSMLFLQAADGCSLVVPGGLAGVNPPTNSAPDSLGLRVVPHIPTSVETASILVIYDSLTSITRPHRIDFSQFYYPGQPTTWGFNTNSFYIGFNLRMGDGMHAAWAKFSKTFDRWSVTDSAWDPIPGRALEVGGRPVEKPAATRYLGSTFTAFPESILGFGTGGYVATHRWTNSSTGLRGVVVRLYGTPGMNWWLNRNDVTQAAALSPRRILAPPLPPDVTVAPAPDGVVLYSRATAANGAVTRVGPLASASEVYCAFSIGDPRATPPYGSANSGWVHLMRGADFETTGEVLLVDASNSSAAISGPQNFSVSGTDYFNQRSSTLTLNDVPTDIDGDGLADFESIYQSYNAGEGISGMPQYNASTELRPLGGTAFAFKPVSQTMLFPMSDTAVLGGSTSWLNDKPTAIVLQSTTRGGNTYAGGITSPARVGVRFSSADGIHYAWLDLTPWSPPLVMFGYPKQATVTPYFNPWPNEPVRLGDPLPGPLRIVRDSSGSIHVRLAPSASGVLESSTLLPDSIWEAVPGGSGSEYVSPATEPKRFFRLR